MALIATMTYDDEDPDVHAHFLQHAHALEDEDPGEWARVLAVFADALREYAERVDAVAAKIGDRLEHEAAARAQLGRDRAPTW
jgi:hypothetical protein